MNVIELLLSLPAVILLIPVSVLLVQVLCALPPRRPATLPQGRRPTVAVVIPAHNESLLIAGTLRRIMPQLAPGDHVLVVADNCTDDTARIAAEAGAVVIERNMSALRGKGYALDFGVRHLELRPPKVVLIIDGDCEVAAGTLDHLARMCMKTGKPVQALYQMNVPAGASLRTRIAGFAWLVKNTVRPLGFHRLGLPCQLMGTGMAFPWRVIRNANLATGHLVEDLKLGIDLAHTGAPALFCPEAHVTSHFPSSSDGMAVQRTRWEHGHLAVMLSLGPRTLLDGIRHGDRNLLALALDLCVPPLALLLMLVMAAGVAGVLLWVATGLALPMQLAATALALLGGAVLLSWARFGFRVITLAQLAYAPFYALTKIPLYLRFIAGRQVEWIRSKRDTP